MAGSGRSTCCRSRATTCTWCTPSGCTGTPVGSRTTCATQPSWPTGCAGVICPSPTSPRRNSASCASWSATGQAHLPAHLGQGPDPRGDGEGRDPADAGRHVRLRRPPAHRPDALRGCLQVARAVAARPVGPLRPRAGRRRGRARRPLERRRRLRSDPGDQGVRIAACGGAKKGLDTNASSGMSFWCRTSRPPGVNKIVLGPCRAPRPASTDHPEAHSMISLTGTCAARARRTLEGSEGASPSCLRAFALWACGRPPTQASRLAVAALLPRR